MSTATLAEKSCKPCEGGVCPTTPADAAACLEDLPGWALASGGQEIEKKWTLKNFVAAMQLAQQIAELAEEEQHHPDLHITGYKHLRVVLTTHAIGGLSENDFILAAKIEKLASC